MTKPGLWTRDFIIVSALNFLVVLVFYLLIVVVGLYASRELQASASQAGLVAGVFIVGTLAGRVLIGQVIDRFGRKRSLLLGLLLAAATSLLYFIQLGIGFLIINRFLHGIGVGFAATAIATVVAHLIPPSRTGEGIGYFSMSASLATAIGPFIGIFMMQHVAFSTILMLCSVLSGACCLVGLWLRVPEIARDKMPRAGLSLARLLEPRVVPLCSIVLLAGVCFSGVLSFLNAYAAERNLTQAASFFFLVYALTLLASRPFVGRLLDRRGANIVMYPAFVLLALGLATLGLAETGAFLLLSALLIGLGFGNLMSSIQAISIRLVEPERMGLATSTFFIFVDSGLGFGPYLLGLIIHYTGYADLYLWLGLMAVFAAGAYYLAHGRKVRARQSV